MRLDDAIATVLPGLRADWNRHLFVCGTANAVEDAITKLALALSDNALVGVTTHLHAPSSATPILLWAEHGPTRTSAQCVRALLRQDPDCIVVHDVVEPELMQLVFTAAETGHQLILAPSSQSLDEVTAIEAAVLAPIGVAPRFTWALLVGDDGATLRSREIVDGVATSWGLFAAPTLIDDVAPTTLADGDDDATAFQPLGDDESDDDDDDDDDDF